jgi:hypothetical protein
VTEVIVAKGFASIHLENILPPPQHILNFLVLVEVGLANQGPTFATAKWAVLTESETKAVFDPLHIFDSLRIFGLILPHLKLPSANKILDKKLFPASGAEPLELFQLKCLSPALEARAHLNGNNTLVPRI